MNEEMLVFKLKKPRYSDNVVLGIFLYLNVSVSIITRRESISSSWTGADSDCPIDQCCFAEAYWCLIDHHVSHAASEHPGSRKGLWEQSCYRKRKQGIEKSP